MNGGSITYRTKNQKLDTDVDSERALICQYVINKKISKLVTHTRPIKQSNILSFGPIIQKTEENEFAFSFFDTLSHENQNPKNSKLPLKTLPPFSEPSSPSFVDHWRNNFVTACEEKRIHLRRSEITFSLISRSSSAKLGFAALQQNSLIF